MSEIFLNAKSTKTSKFLPLKLIHYTIQGSCHLVIMYGHDLPNCQSFAHQTFGVSRFPHHYFVLYGMYYNRVIPDRWKGMSPAQIEEIQKTQQHQIKERQVY